ncbi:MAG: hypothetical protein A2474_00830 [Elusimicrobia bacterium RIFOXYC2_FULL_34_12]|nr:MAG: hypothetical protein A2474_00830 [Elusimicrobia bacterium RIFOXYC2_FULL_34_12]OGS38867.1 MAG: hypothetical protein A2551_03320 [Elusimicrobia bacterium RIFOXYD2_FULL_34_30]HAM39062.1 hypothetical protein [Elusimicrobiota bacterium]
MWKWILFTLFLVSINVFSGCITTKTKGKIILNDEYFQIAHKEVQEAKSSIYLIIYLFMLYDYEDAYPNRLLRDFIDAHNRGVNVNIILEYPKPEYIKEGETLKNQDVFEKLKTAGINVRFDSPKRTTHSKVLVIDKETIILGSHNYSFDGLRYNNDTSVIIKDKGEAKKLIKYFENIE